MEYRTLGLSGLRVSVVGLGCTFFDTAEAYGKPMKYTNFQRTILPVNTLNSRALY